MDKFVIRRSKKEDLPSGSESSGRGLKQARLHQLGGVVILEELQSANKQLSDKNTSSEEKLSILSRLKNKKPAKEILKSTGIGRTVHRLCRNEDTAVAALASEIYQYWKSHILHILQRKPIEVESDAETQRGRSNAKKLVNKSLENSMLSEEIEIHVFKKCKKIMNNTYNRMIRKIHFNLKNDEDQKRRVQEMNCDLKEFVDDVYKQVMRVYSQ